MRSSMDRSIGMRGESWDGRPMPLTTVFIGRPASVNRLEIIRIAHALFAKHGYHSTTIRMITEAASVTIGTLYYWFRSKQILYGTCLELAARKFVDSLPAPNEKTLVFDALAERVRYCAISQKVLTRLFQTLSGEGTSRRERRQLEQTMKSLLRCRSQRFWNWYREYGAHIHKR